MQSKIKSDSDLIWALALVQNKINNYLTIVMSYQDIDKFVLINKLRYNSENIL